MAQITYPDDRISMGVKGTQCRVVIHIPSLENTPWRPPICCHCPPTMAHRYHSLSSSPGSVQRHCVLHLARSDVVLAVLQLSLFFQVRPDFVALALPHYLCAKSMLPRTCHGSFPAAMQLATHRPSQRAETRRIALPLQNGRRAGAP
jgi:hypothetical protein